MSEPGTGEDTASKPPPVDLNPVQVATAQDALTRVLGEAFVPAPVLAGILDWRETSQALKDPVSIPGGKVSGGRVVTRDHIEIVLDIAPNEETRRPGDPKEWGVRMVRPLDAYQGERGFLLEHYTRDDEGIHHDPPNTDVSERASLKSARGLLGRE